jgi:hypothetical protein
MPKDASAGTSNKKGCHQELRQQKKNNVGIVLPINLAEISYTEQELLLF